MAPTTPPHWGRSSPTSIPSPGTSLSLSEVPPLYILPTHFTNDELYIFEERLADHDASLTYDVNEAKVFLSKVLRHKRAALELRTKGLWTEEVPAGSLRPTLSENAKDKEDVRPSKRRKLSQSTRSTASSSTECESTASEDESSRSQEKEPLTPKSRGKVPGEVAIPELDDKIIVVNIDWIAQSVAAGKMLPIYPYIVYTARPIPKPSGQATPKTIRTTVTYIKASPDGPSQTTASDSPAYVHRRRFNQKSDVQVKASAPPQLYRTTTSEFEAGKDVEIPQPPDWVKNHESYACRRSTFANPPNSPFISELQKIKQARILTLDEIGERAYATSMASIAAYRHQILHPAEILQLPGCDTRIASLWAEWRASSDVDKDRFIPAAREVEKDETLKMLKLFYDIWGVGAETARKFVFTKGWKHMDDLIEYGWNELNRVQQIGVKYYEEFLVGIPRLEVESINQVVLNHARKCRNVPKAAYGTKGDFESVIVGGYRRGKEKSGDVDLILSHRDEGMTRDLILDVISGLEQSGWITHTLTLNTTTSDRNQQTLPYRGEGHGHGFDSLDKGLVVWQDPTFEHPTTGHKTNSMAEKAKGAEGAKNDNIHRRVDIIISPWRTVGCAILGWSGATTFERDIRRWTKKEKYWKFDSGGVRDRATGQTVDLESEGDTWEEREKLVMEGLGIGYRPPTERWTG